MELRPDLWHCAGCSTAYAPGLPACPQCGSTVLAGARPEPPPGGDETDDDDETENM